MNTMKIGIIGCGTISSIYMKNIPSFAHLELTACSDLDIDKARSQGEKYRIPKAYTVEEILEDEEIDLIVNLTIPKAHADVCTQVLEAGKHVYVEKPLTVTREEAKRILDIAKKRNLRVGSAPDTFLGAGIQTALHLIEKGKIGTPVGASAFMIGRGHEHWHPDPSFYYDIGGGPLFDMGPYYLTALTALLGPINQLSGAARITYPERTITSKPKAGTTVQVKTPTHLTSILEFSSGAVGTLTTSFDAFGGSTLPPIEIYGSEGTLLVPDPNTFGGQVRIRKKDQKEFVEVPQTHNYYENSRGIGVADMALAIQKGIPHRANGQLAFHVLEAMHGIHDSAEKQAFYEMESTCDKPEAFPINYSF